MTVRVDKVKQKTVVDQVMDQMKDLIASGQLRPHDKIPTETELAHMFGIGRSAVREAIKVFQYLGILEAWPSKGTFVCDYANISVEALTWSILLRKNDMYELIALREVIEERALRELTQAHADAPDSIKGIVEGLENQITRMQLAVTASSMEGIVDSDYEFHRLVISACNNTLFDSIYATLRAFMHEEIRKTNLSEAARSVLVEEHRAILAGITTGNCLHSLTAFQAHVSAIREQLRLSLSTG